MSATDGILPTVSLEAVGDRASFRVPGGRLDFTLTRDGTVQVYGIADMNPRTHQDLVSVRAQAQNSLTITLDRADRP